MGMTYYITWYQINEPNQMVCQEVTLWIKNRGHTAICASQILSDTVTLQVDSSQPRQTSFRGDWLHWTLLSAVRVVKIWVYRKVHYLALSQQRAHAATDLGAPPESISELLRESIATGQANDFHPLSDVFSSVAWSVSRVTNTKSLSGLHLAGFRGFFSAFIHPLFFGAAILEEARVFSLLPEFAIGTKK